MTDIKKVNVYSFFKKGLKFVKRFFKAFVSVSFIFLVLVFLGLYFIYDDQDYCLDSGFRAGDPMCQADENNKLVIVKE